MRLRPKNFEPLSSTAQCHQSKHSWHTLPQQEFLSDAIDILFILEPRALYTVLSILVGRDLPSTPRSKNNSTAHIPTACKAPSCCFYELIVTSSPLNFHFSIAHGLAVHLMRFWRPGPATPRNKLSTQTWTRSFLSAGSVWTARRRYIVDYGRVK